MPCVTSLLPSLVLPLFTTGPPSPRRLSFVKMFLCILPVGGLILQLTCCPVGKRNFLLRWQQNIGLQGYGGPLVTGIGRRAIEILSENCKVFYCYCCLILSFIFLDYLKMRTINCTTARQQHFFLRQSVRCAATAQHFVASCF